MAKCFHSLWLDLLVLFLLLPCNSTVSASVSLGSYRDSVGQLRLFGTSFGLLGSNATFDYVIAGGGTAGLTLGYRLAANGSSVAIIEGGGFYEQDNANNSQIPALAGTLENYDPQAPSNPLIDWEIITPPQPQLQGRQLRYGQGKCLGGGSARNSMVYTRTTVGAMQMWADGVQDSAYSWSNFLQYYKKSVSFTPPNYQKLGPKAPSIMYNGSAFDSPGGPVQVSVPSYYPAIGSNLVRGFANLSISQISGFASGELIGYSAGQVTVDPSSATRSSSETSFGQAAIANTSLLIYKNTFAKHILFNDTKVATGVSVQTAGLNYTLFAKKEVIVSAGAYRSPQLLMASGIGPSAQLAALDIPVVSDLPGVGQNLQDQPFFALQYQTSLPTASQLATNTTLAADAVEQYLTNQSGILSSPGYFYLGAEKMPAVLTSGLSNSTKAFLDSFPVDWPAFFYNGANAGLLGVPASETADFYSIAVAVQASKSRGNVTISSPDTSINPIVTLPWLGTQEDQEIAVMALRRGRQLAIATGSMPSDEYYPGSNVTSDGDILSFLQQTMQPIYHPASTCKMGTSNDSMAVVDSHARVLGVTGLRVVDSSALPFLPPGFPQALVYALAEKIAEDITSGR